MNTGFLKMKKCECEFTNTCLVVFTLKQIYIRILNDYELDFYLTSQCDFRLKTQS